MRYPSNPGGAAARLYPGAALDDDGDYLMCVFVARRERFPAPADAMSAMDGAQLQHTTADLITAWHPASVG